MSALDASNFVLPPVLAGRVWEYLGAVGVAPPSEKLDAFTRAAQRVAGLIGADFPSQEAVDRLWEAAEINGLIDAYDENVVQSRLAEGFSDPILCEELDQFILLRDRGNAEARLRRPTIHATPYVWREPNEIPPRQWIYGRIYIRRFVTANVAPGGTGKSSLALAETIACATGRNLLGIEPRERVKTWYWNLEDPVDEIDRRIAALCQHYNIAPSELEGYLF
jgi:hypothetical protein